jgi:hypothetical protein
MGSEAAAPVRAEPAPDRHAVARFLSRVAPERNARGVVLGTLTIGALLAAEGARSETYPDTALAVVLLLAMYWLSHAYSTGLGLRIERRERWRFGATLDAMRHEVTILSGGLVPLVTLLVCWAAGVELGTGILTAVIASGVAIISLEVMSGVRASLGPMEIVADAAIGALLGVGLLVMKIIFHH